METMEEASQGQKCCNWNIYYLHHFFRNVCNPTLAELLVRKLKNSRHIQEELQDREGSLNRTLFEVLTRVSRKAKRKVEKERKKGAEWNSNSGWKPKPLNNLLDNTELLSRVKVCQFFENVEVNANSMAVKTLSELDTSLLLHSLTNGIFESPLPGIENVLNTLTASRNSLFHNDHCIPLQAVQESIWDGVQAIQEYLGKDLTSFQEKRRFYSAPLQNTSYSLMNELQQEASQWFFKNVPFNEYPMQPTLKHLRNDCQSYKIVENLEKFLEDHRTSGNQEPRPILLCGAPGAGKSAILHSLVHTFSCSKDFQLVVPMDWNNIYMNRDNFWKDVYDFIMNITPLTVQKHGQKVIMNVLRDFSNTFLFLWDLNLHDARNRLPYMDQGTWVLSYQGMPETSTSYCVLKVASLSEEQVRQVLWSITSSEKSYNLVLECYKSCDYKGIINTPDMVRIFDNVCLGMADCAPFYKLIQRYINNKIDSIEGNQAEVIKLGQKVVDIIKNNKKYYSEKCFVDIQSNICYLFLQHSPSNGYYFKYQVVEDYLAALYIVNNPRVACKLWLKQATLFKRVFQIACALWCEKDESLRDSCKYLREYLEKFFDICKGKTKNPRNRRAMCDDNSMGDGAGAGNTNDKEAMEVDHDDKKTKKQRNELAVEADDDNNDRKTKKQRNEIAIEIDDDNNNSRQNRRKNKRGAGERNKYGKKANDKAGEDENEDDAGQNFLRWIFLSKIVKEHQNNQVILELFAEMLACKNIWHFKCKLLSEEIIDNISLVVRYVKLTKVLTVKLETGPNVTLLIKLWNMLCSHQEVCLMTDVHLFIHHTDKNWIMHERELCRLPSIIANTETPLHITKFVGPLLCSSTPQFLKCSCMGRLKVLDVSVYDLPSTQEVLVHQQESLEIVTVKVNLKVEEQIIPDAMQVQLSDFQSEGSKAIRDLKITYFKDLQRLLDTFEPPVFLQSLKIYKVFIHENFKLDLKRFTKMKSLFIRFVETERLPPLLTGEQCEDKMEIENEDNLNLMLPLDCWPLQLVISLHLPVNLERFLVRNLTFCDDSRAPLLLNKYWASLPIQRLILLDTYLSLSKFRSCLNTENFEEEMDITKSLKKCRINGSPGSVQDVVKHDRLKEQERTERRRHKPKGKELIITSGMHFCQRCRCLSCTCSFSGINNGRDTYEDLVSLVKEMYTSEILNVSYNGRDVVLRKDMCGDMHVQCPMPFLNDDTVESPESVAELSQMLDALAFAQIICVSHTELSGRGATCLIDLIRERKRRVGTVEPFRLTILSSYYHESSITTSEVQHSPFMKKIWEYDCLQQFNFKCDCWRKCYIFKRSIDKMIFFNNILLQRK